MSTRTSWRIARRLIARRLRRSVVSVSAPPSPKFHASRGRTFLACFRISGRVTNLSVMAQYHTARGPSGQLERGEGPICFVGARDRTLNVQRVRLALPAIGRRLAAEPFSSL